jgi:hypothetical protein
VSLGDQSINQLVSKLKPWRPKFWRSVARRVRSR